MRFTQWILALEDEDGSLGKFQKLIYSDINNGCASSKFDAIDWKEHFELKHAESAPRLLSLLTVCYVRYMTGDER